MVGTLSDLTSNAVTAGFTAFRVTGEMTWALGAETGGERLIEYERLLNRFFPGSRASAICQYNRERFSPAIIRDVLRTHPQAVIGNNVCTNLYYEPPEFLATGEGDAERVDWMVKQLPRNEQAFIDLRRAQRNQARNARILAGVHDAVVVTDFGGTVTYWNDGATRLFGWTAEEMLARPYAEGFPESMRG